jgi:hypothetical protein
MATDTLATPTGVRLYRLSVDQYLAAIQGNIIPDSAHSELLGGVLVDTMSKNAPHCIVVGRLGSRLGRIVPEPWFVREEKAVKLGRFWYPEPDIAIIRGPDDLFEKQAPQAADIGFLIEASDSSYSIDRGKKWRRYAGARVGIYWIVNISQRRIEVYTDPFGPGRSAAYRQATMFVEGDEVPVVLDGQEIGRIAVRDILPRP